MPEMTPQKAIELINKIAFSVKNEIEEIKASKFITALKMSKQALEKQMPKKTTKRQYVPNGTLIYGHCPICDYFTKNFFKYCRNCGQALDWSDT